MHILEYSLTDIKPYENNPRNNDAAVEAVANSIKEFGWQQPIVVDADGVVIAGHTRYKAAQLLGLDVVPVIVASESTDEQVRAYRLADNKTAELAEWIPEKLEQELSEVLSIDMSLFGFGEEATTVADLLDNKYSMKVDIPQYEITGDCPELSELLDASRADELIAEIEEAEGVTDAEKEFLISAAQRHNVFNYRNIAEYYAHAAPEMQRLMEKSALVIIDVDNAIANGYASLMEDILGLMEDE